MPATWVAVARPDAVGSVATRALPKVPPAWASQVAAETSRVGPLVWLDAADQPVAKALRGAVVSGGLLAEQAPVRPASVPLETPPPTKPAALHGSEERPGRSPEAAAASVEQLEAQQLETWPLEALQLEPQRRCGARSFVDRALPPCLSRPTASHEMERSALRMSPA